MSIATALLQVTPLLGLLVGGAAAWYGRRRQVPAPVPLSEAEPAQLETLAG